MKILVTGFEPFDKETVNPSYEAVKLLPDEINGAQIIKAEIPVVYDEEEKVIKEIITSENPDCVLCIGQAGGRDKITPEFVGINHRNARIPDNAGNQPKELPIKADGENAYFATVPVYKMAQAMNDAGIPAQVSYTAGTFLCNDALYCILYYRAKEKPDMKCGFIHVPFETSQVKDKPGMFAMPIEEIAKGLEIAIAEITKA